MSNFVSTFVRKVLIRSLFKDIQADNLAHFKKIEATLEALGLQTPSLPAVEIRRDLEFPLTGNGYDLIVSHNEICDNHGTGVLLKRLFGHSKNLLHIRSTTQFGGSSIGTIQVQLSHSGKSRQEAFFAMSAALKQLPITRILCVPFYADDTLSAIAAKEITGVSMCLYLMDDQNINTSAIPDDLMRELIEKSKVRFAIGPEMRDAYEKKYGHKFSILPPTASHRLIRGKLPVSNPAMRLKTGAMVGNIWAPEWLEALRRVIRKTDYTLHWFGNTAKHMLAYDEKELAKDGIVVQGFPKEEELWARLQEYPFAVVPSAPDVKSHQWLSALSLPSRLPYLMATANIPIINLSIDNTPAANFVRHFDIGIVSNYDPESFRTAAGIICTPESQHRYRSNSAKAATSFSSEGIGDWIWASLEKCEPSDYRFERLFENMITSPRAVADRP